MLASRISRKEFLSTPSARRATLPGADSVGGDSVFLSTPSARRATLTSAVLSCSATEFLSTPSARRATACALSSSSRRVYFYPRPPRGGRRRMWSYFKTSFLLFLSTPSARRATSPVPLGSNVQGISIHALREEGDGSTIERKERTTYFYPRPPRGGRPLVDVFYNALRTFLSTPSARRATCSDK